MAEDVKFYISFRMRLILLLSSFLLLTIGLVLALDKWAQERASEEVIQQSAQVNNAVNSGFTDFAKATYLAIKNLNSVRYLYKQIQAGEITLPDTVEHIIAADQFGALTNTTDLALNSMSDWFMHSVVAGGCAAQTVRGGGAVCGSCVPESTPCSACGMRSLRDLTRQAVAAATN